VIASHLPEIARLVREYEIGEVVNPEDPAAIAAGIRCLLEDPDRYAKARANTLRAAAIFNWEVEQEKLLALYRQIAGSQAG
jgi:glycosyltransferase involved in cell wall biosynthesis